MLCGFGFMAIKFVEYFEKLSVGLTPATNDFYMLYFVLTGLHLFHLIVGLAVLIVARSLAGRPVLTNDQERIVEGCSCFWHMVDLLWLVLFPLIFLVR